MRIKSLQRTIDRPTCRHEFGADLEVVYVYRVLAQKLDRHVFAIDLRNHGESPHDHKHDYTVMADDVAGFIEEHKLEQPTLLGHSM